MLEFRLADNKVSVRILLEKKRDGEIEGEKWEVLAKLPLEFPPPL